MHLRTRNLLKLLTEETTDAVLGELRKGPRTEVELIKSSPSARSATRTCLRDLMTWEVVRSGKAPASGKRGSPPNLFSVTATELFEFCDQADAFALALSKAQTESLQQHVEELPDG